MKSVGWLLYSNSPNPFAQDSRKPRKPYIADSKVRDAVLKQAFHPNKVLGEKWDAIIIGSGMGGLTVALRRIKALLLLALGPRQCV